MEGLTFRFNKKNIAPEVSFSLGNVFRTNLQDTQKEIYNHKLPRKEFDEPQIPRKVTPCKFNHCMNHKVNILEALETNKLTFDESTRPNKENEPPQDFIQESSQIGSFPYVVEVISYMKNTISEYQKEHLGKLRRQHHVDRTLQIWRQNAINEIIRICHWFNCNENTLATAVYLFDLAGKMDNISIIVCIKIAMKMEEIYPSGFNDVAKKLNIAVKISPQEIAELELIILKKLDYKVQLPTCKFFLEIYSSQVGLSSEERETCYYLLNVLFYNYELFKTHGSILAAGIIKLAASKRLDKYIIMRKLVESSKEIEESINQYSKKILEFHSNFIYKSDHHRKHYIFQKFSKINQNLKNLF